MMFIRCETLILKVPVAVQLVVLCATPIIRASLVCFKFWVNKCDL